jgi:hypothetical protein
MFGIALLGAAAQRCHRTVRDHDAAGAAAEAALRAEDAAGEPTPTEAAPVEAAPTAVAAG